jgi:hypothetical protein
MYKQSTSLVSGAVAGAVAPTGSKTRKALGASVGDTVGGLLGLGAILPYLHKLKKSQETLRLSGGGVKATRLNKIVDHIRFATKMGKDPRLLAANLTGSALGGIAGYNLV